MREVQLKDTPNNTDAQTTIGRAASGGSFTSHTIKLFKPQPTHDITQRSYLERAGQIPASSQTVCVLIHRGTPHASFGSCAERIPRHTTLTFPVFCILPLQEKTYRIYYMQHRRSGGANILPAGHENCCLVYKPKDSLLLTP
jgi:hypothetical protein